MNSLTLSERLRCIVHEDEHILVVNKPAGLNTHSPSPYAGEGLFEWLRNREPRWASLAIIHRLDKATSGLIVFAKTKVANQSLTQQFTDRKIQKRYVLLTTEHPHQKEFEIQSGILRNGERYIRSNRGEPAETRFNYDGEVSAGSRRLYLVEAHPLTGRTHQIRVHAEAAGIPILGDALYSGADFPRLCLHSEEISFRHPGTADQVSYCVEPEFYQNPAEAFRAALFDPQETNAFRLIHGEGDNSTDLYVEKWGDHLLVQSGNEDWPRQFKTDDSLSAVLPCRKSSKSIYFKLLNKTVGKTTTEDSQPKLVWGSRAPENFSILENGVRYEISFEQGYSVGLFPDQRDNRRRLLKNYAAPGFELFPDGPAGKEVLNTFSYTCGFSVCAALAGARTTSLDLSKKYLEWGKRNFALNKLDPAQHDFIYGDLFDWAPRLAKKGRQFDLIILDPPTFSHSKTNGIFQAEKHYGKLVTTILPLLKPGGILFASTNTHKLEPEAFLTQIRKAATTARRPIQQEFYAPQP
ncbi:MAG TPA: pseudouridine synthase, partial [Candidatus Kapabacteria bacterium]|nr:pseudouridine synthase [Candidatus Kapabacteria bacterium]